MNEEKNALIEQYFNGLLDNAGIKDVEQRRITDAVFAEAFQVRQDMEDWLMNQPQRVQVQAQLQEFGKMFFADAEASDTPTNALKVSFVQKWMAAAAMLVAVIAAVWFINRPTDLYSKYAVHDPLQITVRSSGGNTAANAEQAFNEKKYGAALLDLKSLITEDPTNLTIQLNYAICLIETGSTTQARTFLLPIAAGQSGLKSEAQWNIALSYLKEKDKANCIAALEAIARGDRRYDQAVDLQEALK